MAKPAITKYGVKGSPLTTSELDTNFQNLTDATVTLTAGSGGTAVTSDLNGTITLVAGSNITLTGDNTAKTITITSSSGSGTINSGTTGKLALYAGSTTIDDSNISVSANILTASAGSDFKLSSDTTFVTIRNGSDGRVDIIPGGNGYLLIGSSTSGRLQLYAMTTTDRNALTDIQDGQLIYNSSTGKFQGRAAGAWVDLH
jgi:hypothetical protein